MENAILIFVLALILGGAVAYIVRAKKRGARCIGCPAAGCCGDCSSGCGSNLDSKKRNCESEEETK